MDKRIMLSGPSGTGKTTLAKHIEDKSDIPFISGSLSDLIPETKDIPHQDMLSRDSDTLLKEDWQLLNLRNKLFREKFTFVTDRSYLDSAAYFTLKQASKIPACEVDNFLGLCKMALCQQCTHLIYVPFNKPMFKEWIVEPNDKRITSKYFQMEVSAIMDMILNLWDLEITREDSTLYSGFFDLFKSNIKLNQGFRLGHIDSSYGTVQVLILDEIKLDNRLKIIDSWLNLK